MKELKGITKEELQTLIDHYEKMGKTFYWSTPANASGRRYEERKNSRDIEFEYDGKKYHVEIAVSCSCRNYYAARTVSVDDEEKKQGLRALKTVLRNV